MEDVLSYYICKFVIPFQEQRKSRNKESPWLLLQELLGKQSFQEGQIKTGLEIPSGKESREHKLQEGLTLGRARAQVCTTKCLQGRESKEGLEEGAQALCEATLK